MQLLFERSEEGDVDCLGLLPGRVRAAAGRATASACRTWAGTAASRRATHPLLDGIADGAQAYFVHSYAAPVDRRLRRRPATHGERFAAVVQRGRICGAQFHPERSAAVGARLLRNFLRDVPA